MAKFTLHFDGSCWPNPGGTAAYGTVLELEGQQEPLCAEAGVIGTNQTMSNNVAEFHALAVGLERYLEYAKTNSGVKGDDIIEVRGDSNLVIKMMSGEWSPNPSKLYYPAYLEAFRKLSIIEMVEHATVNFKWIPRAENQKCDDLSKLHNQAPK